MGANVKRKCCCAGLGECPQCSPDPISNTLRVTLTGGGAGTCCSHVTGTFDLPFAFSSTFGGQRFCVWELNIGPWAECGVFGGVSGFRITVTIADAPDAFSLDIGFVPGGGGGVGSGVWSTNNVGGSGPHSLVDFCAGSVGVTAAFVGLISAPNCASPGNLTGTVVQL